LISSKLFAKALGTRKKKNKLPFHLQVICFLLRPLCQRRGAFCFVATPDRPWGCNLEAYFMHLHAMPNIRLIYILNLSTTPSAEIVDETLELPIPVNVVSRNERLRLLQCIIRSEIFFLGDYPDYRIPGKKINLWHGIPLKKIGVLQNKKWKKLGRRFSNVISAASKLDQNNMSLAFNMENERVIPSGLPRHDWIMGKLKTPRRFDRQLKELAELLDNRKLVLYAPTFRDESRDALPLSIDKIEKWADFLKNNGYILGIRSHVTSKFIINSKELGILDLSGDKYHHIEAVYQLTEILVTDYSSVCLDFMLTNKTIIGLDLSKIPYDRGFINDLSLSFPGHFFRDFDLFLNYLSKLISKPEDDHLKFDYSFQKNLFLGEYEGNACPKLTELICNKP